jgi:DNA repair photolyase
MILREIKVKSILGKSSIGDYCVNPYVGCMIGCIYCYADYYTRKFSNHEDEWGSYVDVKINAPEVLLKEITKKKKGTIYISPLTDAYQPIEAKYKITRKILEILARYDWPVVIQTKSILVLRDLDILKKFENLKVGFTIISLDEKITRKFEKMSSTPNERIKALKILKENGIKTFVFIGPILPFTKFEDIREVINESRNFADEFYFDRLNLKLGMLQKIKMIKGYENTEEIEMNKYYKGIKKEILEFTKKESINSKILF